MGQLVPIRSLPLQEYRDKGHDIITTFVPAKSITSVPFTITFIYNTPLDVPDYCLPKIRLRAQSFVIKYGQERPLGFR